MTSYSLSQLEGFFVETFEVDSLEDPEMLAELSTWLNMIYIFREKNNVAAGDSLYFVHCLDHQDNYNYGFSEAYGRVVLEEQNLHFFTETLYEENLGGGLGYDTTYFRRSVFVKKEAPSDTYAIFLEDQDVCFRVTDRVFKPLQGREGYYCRNENEMNERVQHRYKKEDERWENNLVSYVLRAHKQGKTNDDILNNITSEGWNLNRVENIIKTGKK